MLKKSPEGVAFSRKKKVEKNKQLKRISINYDRKSVIDPALARHILHHTNIPNRLFQRSFEKKPHRVGVVQTKVSQSGQNFCPPLIT